MIRSILPQWANRARSQRELIQKLYETHFTIFSPEKTKEDWGIYSSTSRLLPQRFRIAPRAFTSYTCCAGKTVGDTWGGGCHCPRDSLGYWQSREKALTFQPVVLPLSSCCHSLALLHSLPLPSPGNGIFPPTCTTPAQRMWPTLLKVLDNRAWRASNSLTLILSILFSVGLWKWVSCIPARALTGHFPPESITNVEFGLLWLFSKSLFFTLFLFPGSQKTPKASCAGWLTVLCCPLPAAGNLPLPGPEKATMPFS